VGCEAAGFGSDLGIDLKHGPVAVFEDVVLVVEFGEALGQGQLMPVLLVNPGGELPRRELTGEHAAREGSGGGFLTGPAADRIEGEGEFVESCGKQNVDVVVRLGTRACGECAKARAVESGDERITGGMHHVARTNLPRAPESGMVLQSDCCCFGRRHASMIPFTVLRVEQSASTQPGKLLRSTATHPASG
jgi:hypothetical protein